MTGHDHGGWRHCPRCGGRLPPRRLPLGRAACEWCGWARFDNPPVAVVAVVRRGDEVLMVLRAEGAARAGAWSLPGGHVDPGEDPLAALARELTEECGVVLVEARLVSVARAAHGGGPIVITYLAQVAGEPTASDDAEGVGWFPPDALPPLAFPEDRVRVADAGTT